MSAAAARFYLFLNSTSSAAVDINNKTKNNNKKIDGQCRSLWNERLRVQSRLSNTDVPLINAIQPVGFIHDGSLIIRCVCMCVGSWRIHLAIKSAWSVRRGESNIKL